MKSKICLALALGGLLIAVLWLWRERADLSGELEKLEASSHQPLPSTMKIDEPGTLSVLEGKMTTQSLNRGSLIALLKSKMAAVQPNIKLDRTRAVEKTYSFALGALNLSPEQTHKVEAILIERASDLADAQHLALEQHIRGADFRKTVADAASLAETALKSSMPVESYKQLQAIMGTEPYLEQINSAQALDLQYAGTPLTPSQLVSLASVLKEVDQTDNHTSRALEADIDSQLGLSQKDLEILERSSAFLTANQIETLASSMRTAVQNRNLPHTMPAVTVPYILQAPPVQ